MILAEDAVGFLVAVYADCPVGACCHRDVSAVLVGELVSDGIASLLGIEIEAHGGWIGFGIGAPVEHHFHVLPVGMVVAEVLVLAG